MIQSIHLQKQQLFVENVKLLIHSTFVKVKETGLKDRYSFWFTVLTRQDFKESRRQLLTISTKT